MKKGLRKLVFFNRAFDSVSAQQDEVHTVGPFSSLMVFDSMMKLGASLTNNEFDPTLFFEPVDPELLKKGYALFCERHDFEPYAFTSLRSVIAVGLWWQRHAEVAADETETDIQDEIEQEISEEHELEATPEDVADRFERHFLRAGRAYARAQRLTKLMNSDIDFKLVNSDSRCHLVIRQGHMQSVECNPHSPVLSNKYLWAEHSIETYDRMSVLLSELEKIKSQNGFVHISFVGAP
ncbi:MAG: hypothetical protein EOP09_14330 [Proteobacteria bacterium]|nr:MAG: hypothetical protein EOP09_14330 [Pseudomonadota bacterium]